MDLSCKNTEITLWQHHIKYICYRIFEENLYCENIQVFFSFLFLTPFQRVRITGNYPGHRKYLKHKPCLTKDSVYFGVIIYSLQTENIFSLLKVMLVNLHSWFNLSLSNKVEKLFRLTHRMQYAQKRQEQISSRHNQPLYLSMLVPN